MSDEISLLKKRHDTTTFTCLRKWDWSDLDKMGPYCPAPFWFRMLEMVGANLSSG